MSSAQSSLTPPPTPLEVERDRLASLELRSLLAEQVRQQAHTLRTPLSVIKLIAETLQIDLLDDRSSADRLGHLLGSVSDLSASLTDTVRSTRFGDGPLRCLDAQAMAAGVIQAFGGRIASASIVEPSFVMLEPDSFEAALVHALRLIGIGPGYAVTRASAPVLHCQRTGAWLNVRLSSNAAAAQVATARADLQLMALAAERAARDSGGTLTLTHNSASFELPLAVNTRKQ